MIQKYSVWVYKSDKSKFLELIGEADTIVPSDQLTIAGETYQAYRVALEPELITLLKLSLTYCEFYRIIQDI